MSAYTALKLTEAFGELSNLHKIIRVLQTSFPMLANVITGVRGAMEAGFTATQTFKIALSGLWDVIKAHPIIALTAAVVAVASAIGFAQKKAEEARQQQAEKNKEVIDTYNQEQESIENLISRYKELANNDRTDSSNREAIKNVQDEITELVGKQAENLDLVNGKLDEELQKLNGISKANQENATAAFRSAFTSEYDKWGSTYFNSSDNSFFGGIHRFLGIDNNNRISTKGGVWNSQDKLLTTEQDRALRELIEEIYARRGETFKGSTNDFYLSENPSERIKELREIVNLLGKTGATESEQFKDFSSYLTTMEEMMSSSVEATNNLMKNLLGVKLNSVDTVSKLNSISSLDEYSSMRDSLISELSDDSQIKQALSQGFINKESIEKFVDDTLSTLPQISTYYNQWVGKFKDTSKKADKIVKTSFSNLIADEDFKKQVDEYKNKFTELDDALEKLRSGNLGEEDKIKLFEDFPELAGQADNLDEAIVNLIDSLESDAIDDFNDKLDYMETDDDVAALNALKNSILGLAKTKNGVTDLKSEISKLKTTLDDLSNTYSDMKSIIDDYNENGYLTLDNLQSIMDLEPQYVNLLIDENGQINLNSQAYKEYIAAKAKALLVDELKDLYSTVLNMKLEEAQAYANAEAYNAETRSVKDLLAATTELYLIKAKQKDLANNTTVYTDAMSRSFNTAANYAAMVDSYINSLSTSQNEFSVSTEQATSALEAEKDALEAQKDALNDSKDALEDYKDGLSDAQSKIKDLIDLVQDYIKQMKENEMDALSDQIDALEEQKDNYSEIISQKKEAIELAKQEREEAEKLSDLQQAVAKDTLSLAVANLDDSSAGRKAQKVAKDKLIQSNKDLQDELNQQAYDKRIEALEQDEEEYSNHIDKRIEALNKEKDAIQEYLDNVRQLYEDACNMIDNDTGDLYGKLWNDYVYPYTTQTHAEFDNLWYSAQEAIQRYIGDNNSLIGVMEYLQTEIYNTDEQIGELELQIGDLETAIDNTNSMIDNTSTSIDNVSTSLDGLGTTIADYMAQLAELQAAANNIDVNPNPGGEKTKFYVTHNGKTYETGYNYNGDTEGNRLLAAAELTKQIAKDISGFDQYGLGIVQGYLGVGTGGAKEWYVDLNGHRYTAVSKTKDNAIKQIMAQGIDPRAGYYVRDHIQHYATGTYSSVGGVAITQENNKLEEIFGKLQNGQYTMLSEGSHVLDSQATTNLHRFADNPPEFVAQALNYSGYLGKVENAARNVVRNIDNHSSGNTEVSAPISISIQGDASQSTVKAIEKAGREIETRIIKKLVRFGNINKKPMY